MLVEAWQCPIHGDLIIATDKDAIKTRKYENRAALREQTKIKKRIDAKKAFMDEARATLSSPYEIIEWAMHNYNEMTKLVNTDQIFAWEPQNRKIRAEDTQLSFKADFREDISNSHNCPEHGVTNWGKNHADRPTSYPGYQGRIYIKNTNPESSIMSSGILNLFNIHTGSGGGGPDSQTYEMYLFLDDWPLLENHLVMERLHNA